MHEYHNKFRGICIFIFLNRGPNHSLQVRDNVLKSNKMCIILMKLYNTAFSLKMHHSKGFERTFTLRNESEL